MKDTDFVYESLLKSHDLLSQDIMSLIAAALNTVSMTQEPTIFQSVSEPMLVHNESNGYFFPSFLNS